jgi:hypothetical protein
MPNCEYVDLKQANVLFARCNKHVAEGKRFCWQHDPERPNPQAELKRKAAIYDRLVARLAPNESLHPDLRKFVPFINAILEGKE